MVVVGNCIGGRAMSTMETYWDSPSFEVCVYRDGELVERELCETEDDAADAVDAWSEVDGVVCRVQDLSAADPAPGLLDPLPWEVDADSASFDDGVDEGEEW
jgi:hypothetical protein